MSHEVTIFDLFGGIRPMARKLGVLPSSVSAWKREGRIPAHKQPHVLEVGQSLGLPITAEHVVFPLGRPNAAVPSDISAHPAPVACDQKAGTQRKGAGR
jgi:hypothetical protein